MLSSGGFPCVCVKKKVDFRSGKRGTPEENFFKEFRARRRGTGKTMALGAEDQVGPKKKTWGER